MNNNLNIKFIEATVNDCEILASLKIVMWKTTYSDIYPKEKIENYNFEENVKKFKSLILNKNISLYFVVFSDKIIGYFSVGKMQQIFKTYNYEIGLFYLLKEYRGLGIGKNVFDFCYKFLKSKNVKEFIISCNKYNFPAQKFYEKMGGYVIYEDDDFDIDKSKPQIKYLYKIDD